MAKDQVMKEERANGNPSPPTPLTPRTSTPGTPGATYSPAPDSTPAGEGRKGLPALQKRKVAALVIILILVCALLYVYVVPRTALQVETLYHQSFSGNSVGVKFKNTGTRDISNLSVDMNVTRKGENDTLLHPEPLTELELTARESYEFSGNYRGSQLDQYVIILIISFESGGKDYNETLKYTTGGEFMNEGWKDTIR